MLLRRIGVDKVQELIGPDLEKDSEKQEDERTEVDDEVFIAVCFDD